MKLIITAFTFLITLNLFFSGCKKNTAIDPAPEPAKPIIGFNQNWSFLPALNPLMLSNINMLKPQMIRYPGGTVTYSWDWVQGIKSGGSVPHPIQDIKKLVTACNSKMIFVVDILTRSLDDQLLMLTSIKNLGIPIEYVELGNELYSNDSNFAAVFPTGTEYATKAVLWTTALKQNFPTVKIAALLAGKNSNNSRLNQWNSLVVSGTISVVDAYTYHIYIPPGGTFEARKNEFEAIANTTNTSDKELWITEYGSQNLSTTFNYLSSLDSLANYVEAYPKVTIALNHNIVGPADNKLTPDGNNFTDEGRLFITRAANR